MRYELKSLGAWAFIKVSFFLNLIIGFVFGLLYAGFMALILAAASASPFEEFGPMPFEMDEVGPVLLILLPIFFAIAGAIFYTLFGLIIVGLYNLIARLVGGFEMTLEPVELNRVAQPIQPTPTPQAPPPPPQPTYQPPPPPPPPPPPSTEPPPNNNPETP